MSNKKLLTGKINSKLKMESEKLQIKNENLSKGWRKVKLGEVGYIITGKTPPLG